MFCGSTSICVRASVCGLLRVVFAWVIINHVKFQNAVMFSWPRDRYNLGRTLKTYGFGPGSWNLVVVATSPHVLHEI